jgi:transposase
MTHNLMELVDWVKESRCTHVAMESTGDYWKPIYNLLELEDVQPMVVNAQHIKAVPGRKTDVKDAGGASAIFVRSVRRGNVS